MLRLLEVRFSGFLAYYEQQRQRLSDLGLCLIIGENRQAGGSDSNGAGKTTIYDAVTWALYGETVTGEKTEEVLHREAASAQVDLDIEDETAGRQYRITRVRKRKGGGELGLRDITDLDDVVDLTESTMAATQERIISIVGLDSLAFRTCILFGQGESKRFGSDATTDGERKAIFRSVTRMGVCEDARKATATKRRELENRLADLEQEKRHLNDQFDQASDDLERTREQHEDWNAGADERVAADQAKLDRLLERVDEADGVDDELAELDEAVEAAEARVERLDALNARYEEAREQVRAADKVINDAELEGRTATADLRAAKASLTELLEQAKAGRCGTCGSDLADEDNTGFILEQKRRKDAVEAAMDALVEANEAIEAAQDAGKGCTAAASSLWEEIEALDDPKAELTRLGRQRADLAAKAGQLDALRQQADELEQRIKEERARPSPHKEAITRLKTRRGKLRRKLGRAEALASEVTAELELATFWSKGFSTRGVQSFAIDHILPRLTSASQEYLDALSSGDLQIEFDTVAKLKSRKDEVRDKFSINTRIEGHLGMKVSGAQKTKVALSASFGLSDLVAEREGAALDCYFLDEVFDGLDPTGKDRLLELLQLLRSRRSTILAVSHDPDVARHFDHVIRVVREDGRSRLEGGPK